MTHELTFSSSHNQFYIGDPEVADSEIQNMWSDSTYKARLDAQESIIGIRVANYERVRLKLVVLTDQDHSKSNFKSYDHIVEGSLRVSKGFLSVINCPNFDIEQKIELQPGIYRIRVYSSELDSVHQDEDQEKDHYLIEIWQEPHLKNLTVLKQYAH